MLLLSHINDHIIHLFPTFFLIFFLINFSTYCYTFSNFSSSFYLFISPLLYTLISLFFYLFIFLYFLLFLFPSSYYKFTILFFIPFIGFSHRKCNSRGLNRTKVDHIRVNRLKTKVDIMDRMGPYWIEIGLK